MDEAGLIALKTVLEVNFFSDHSSCGASKIFATLTVLFCEASAQCKHWKLIPIT